MFTDQAFVASSKAVSVLCRERNPDWQPSSNFATVVERYVFGSTIEGVIETANASDEAARKLVKSRVESLAASPRSSRISSRAARKYG